MDATYVEHSGSDLTVVNSARVSFSKHSEEFAEEDGRLIRYLARHDHWTPFAHPSITLRMKAPVFIRTQCFKHKQGFVENEISRRYVDDEPELFWPILRQRSESAKQGSKNEFPVRLEYCESILSEAHFMALRAYKMLLNEGVAPEQARMVLPQSMYTEWYWTGSLAAYARFFKQRTDSHSQVEIQELAKKVGAIIQPLFPLSWEALTVD